METTIAEDRGAAEHLNEAMHGSGHCEEMGPRDNREL